MSAVVVEASRPCSSLGSQPIAALSAKELHRIVLDCKKVGNRARYELIRVLRTFKETGLHLKLGFPDIVSYADRMLGYKRATTFEAISVAEKLEDLPRCTDSFTRGKLSWSALREIVRVADAGTEAQWLDYAAESSAATLHIEVQDAVEKKRSTPRRDGYGLPNLKTKLIVELTLAEQEILERGLSQVATAMGESVGEEPVSTKDVLLFLARRALATSSGDPLEDRSERGDPYQTVLYHTCPTCRRSRMATKHGMVEVAPEVVARIEGDANLEAITLEEETPKEETSAESGATSDRVPDIDRPNPGHLSRRVKLRDGGVCSNPNCGRSARHSHHVVFRSAGGRTSFSNETAVCEICHALIHDGLLHVMGSSHEGLSWSTAVDSGELATDEESDFLSRIPVVESAHAESPPARVDHTGEAVAALIKLGFGKGEAGERVAAAVRVLMVEDVEITE